MRPVLLQHWPNATATTWPAHILKWRVYGSIWFRDINKGGARAWLRLSTLGLWFPCVCLDWESSNSLVLTRLWIHCEWVIPSALHWEITSSGTRCSCCKPIVLVRLRGCHLLDGLVACDSIKARKKILWCSREEIVRAIVLTCGDHEEQH
jgi:hypothetical protein